jgi:UDP-N-acetylglucosamine 2-epimerase (non-hydrolysing)
MRAGAVAMVFGTRPEVVKLAPVAWVLGPSAVTVHTGQHPATALEPLYADLGLGHPDVALEVARRPRGRQIGEAVAAVTDALQTLAPDIVVVQGDTNSTLAGALAADSLDLPVVHVEAGLRSFDRAMPEERNRIVVDHLAALLCAPTPTAAGHLRAEGIAAERIVITGNTVVDAARRCLPDEATRRAVCARVGVVPDGFVLATFHRPENVDDPGRLREILDALRSLPRPVLLPVHPRTVDRAADHGVTLDGDALRTIEPVGYREFLALEASSALVVSDSGGVQEEVSVLGRPAVIARTSTERPEVIGSFARLVDPGAAIGPAAREVLDDIDASHAALRDRTTPYGDGRAGEHTVAAIEAWSAAAPGPTTIG